MLSVEVSGVGASSRASFHASRRQLKTQKHKPSRRAHNTQDETWSALYIRWSTSIAFTTRIAHEARLNIVIAAMSKSGLLPSEPPPPYEDNPKAPNAHSRSPSGTPGARRPPQGPPPPLNLASLNALRRQRVVLASASPRRRQLLAQVGASPARYARQALMAHSSG